MSDFAHDYTDKEIETLEKRITKAYRRVYKELSEKVTDYFKKFEKRDTEQLALLNEGKITELEYQQWRLAQMGRGKRFEAMRDDAAERLTKANQIAASYIKDEMPDIFAVNLNHMAYGLEKEYGNIGFTIYNEEMAKKLIADEADFLPAPSINVPKDLWWNKKLITAEMTSGILQGENLKKLADRFQNVTDANRVSAIRNARTFCTAAENAGRQEGFNQAAKMGIKVRKQWLAIKDNRTRHSHQLLDKQIVDYDKPFKSVLGSKMMYPADKNGAVAGDLYNCRCSMRFIEKEGIVAEPVMERVQNPKWEKAKAEEDALAAKVEKLKRQEEREKDPEEKKRIKKERIAAQKELSIATQKRQSIPKNVVIKEMTYKEWEQWKRTQFDD